MGVFLSTRVEKENASADEEPPGAIFSFSLSGGNGVSMRFFGVDGVVGDCSGRSSYSIGLSKRLTGSVGYSGFDSVSLIRAHNLIEYGAKVQIDRLKSNEENPK